MSLGWRKTRVTLGNARADAAQLYAKWDKVLPAAVADRIGRLDLAVWSVVDPRGRVTGPSHTGFSGCGHLRRRYTRQHVRSNPTPGRGRGRRPQGRGDAAASRVRRV